MTNPDPAEPIAAQPVPEEGSPPRAGLSPVMLGVLAGVVTCVVGALIWAGVTMVTDMQIGWMAVGVGILVGFGVGFFNREQSAIYGVIGAGFAVLGCLLGNAFTVVGVLAGEEHVSCISMFFQMDWTAMPGILVEMFSPIDLLFYAIAIYEGYKFAARGRV